MGTRVFFFRFFQVEEKTKNAAASAAGFLRLRCSASVFVKFSTRGIFFEVGEKKIQNFWCGNFPPFVGKKVKHLLVPWVPRVPWVPEKVVYMDWLSLLGLVFELCFRTLLNYH